MYSVVNNITWKYYAALLIGFYLNSHILEFHSQITTLYLIIKKNVWKVLCLRVVFDLISCLKDLIHSAILCFGCMSVVLA